MSTSEHCGLEFSAKHMTLQKTRKGGNYPRYHSNIFFTKPSFHFSATLKIHKLDIPRITCAMSVIQALLIHSSCVYTGEIAF